MPFDRLQHFESRQMRLDFEWGVTDCMTLPADWIVETCGFDPMANLRGRYDSAARCQRLTGFFTDPVAAMGHRLDALARAETPARGDVGIVLQAGHRVGAIHLGGRTWLARAPAGLTVFEPGKVLVAWSVGIALREAAA